MMTGDYKAREDDTEDDDDDADNGNEVKPPARDWAVDAAIARLGRKGGGKQFWGWEKPQTR